MTNVDLEAAILNNEISKINIYGSDMELSLLEDENTIFDTNKIRDYTREYTNEINETWPGTTSAYHYIGSIGSIFAWHTEDLNFNSISVLLCGKLKIWYVIAPNDYERFEAIVKKLASHDVRFLCGIRRYALHRN